MHFKASGVYTKAAASILTISFQLEHLSLSFLTSLLPLTLPPFFRGLLPPSHLPQWLTSNLSIVAHLYLGNTRYLTVSGCFLEPSPCLCSLPLIKFFFFLVCLSSRTCIPTFFVIVYNNSLIDNFLPAAFFWGSPSLPLPLWTVHNNYYLSPFHPSFLVPTVLVCLVTTVSEIAPNPYLRAKIGVCRRSSSLDGRRIRVILHNRTRESNVVFVGSFDVDGTNCRTGAESPDVLLVIKCFCTSCLRRGIADGVQFNKLANSIYTSCSTAHGEGYCSYAQGHHSQPIRIHT